MVRPRDHFGARGTVKPSAPKYPATTPDIDKLARALLDALTGVLVLDDKQVVELTCRKSWAEYSPLPGSPGASVLVAGMGVDWA
jgi:hypothetical protein